MTPTATTSTPSTTTTLGEAPHASRFLFPWHLFPFSHFICQCFRLLLLYLCRSVILCLSNAQLTRVFMFIFLVSVFLSSPASASIELSPPVLSITNDMHIPLLMATFDGFSFHFPTDQWRCRVRRHIYIVNINSNLSSAFPQFNFFSIHFVRPMRRQQSSN